MLHTLFDHVGVDDFELVAEVHLVDIQMVDFLDAGEIALFFAHFELREGDEGFKRISP